MKMTFDPLVGSILLQQAKRNGTTVDEQVDRFLKAGLRAERERILRERSALAMDGEIAVPSMCSEEYLRTTCGDLWEVCWWASSCSMLP